MSTRALLGSWLRVGAALAVVATTTTGIVAHGAQPAAAQTTISCSPNEIIGGDTNGNLVRVDPTTLAETIEFTTAQSPIMNGLASNTDDGLVYWGSGTDVFWYDSETGSEGVLANFGATINGNLESAGAAYLNGFYYFGVEDANGSAGLYRVQIDGTGFGIVGGAQQLAPDQPETGLDVLYPGVNPDYGDILAVENGSGQTVLYGSTANRGTTAVDFWSYNVDTGAFTSILRDDPGTLIQLGRDASGDVYGFAAATNEYFDVDLATGGLTSLGTTGTTLVDLGDTFCTRTSPNQLDLTKSAALTDDVDGTGTVTAGDELTFTMVATNTSVVPLSNVRISDPLIPAVDLSCTPAQPATLLPGATLTCTGTYTVTGADGVAGTVDNTATVSIGSTPRATATASTPVDPISPSVVKTSDAVGPVEVGDTIVYTVTVTNDDAVPHTALTVTDALAPGTTYVPESTVVDGFRSTFVSTSRTIGVNEGPATISETATACANPLIRTFTVADDLTITDLDLGVDLSHTWRGDVVMSLISPLGTTVAITTEAGGDGDDNIDVRFDSDSANPFDDNNADVANDAGYDRSARPVGNLGSFDGEPSLGTWQLTICDTFSADNGTFHSAQLFVEGDGVVADPIVLDNVPAGATSDLTDGVPSDLVVVADGLILEPGDSMTVTYAATVDTVDGSVSSLDNTVSIDTAEGPPVTASDSVELDVAPVLQVEKTGPASAGVGDTVTYSFAVSHDPTSDGSPASSVGVTDDVAGAASYVSGDDGDGLLESGETWLFQASHTLVATASDPVVNTATTSALDVTGAPVPVAVDTHSLDVEFAPVIQVAKTGPASAATGDTVTYTYAVSHAAGSDGSPVSGIVVGDDVTGTPTLDSGDDGDGLLEAGETWIFSDTHLVGPGDPATLTNTVTVDGTDRDGDPVATATDTHDLAVDYQPEIELTKSGPATAAVGDTVTYTFTVAHAAGSDGSPIASVVLDDPQVGAPTYVSGDDGDGLLESGETWTYEATTTIAPTDPDPLPNTATVSGSDGDGEGLSDSDGHSIDIAYDPVLQLTKTAVGSAAVGDTVTYTITVAHDAASDGSPVGTVVVDDPDTTTPTYVSGDDGDGLLEAGETWTYTATREVLADDVDPYVNTATVAGVDPEGDPVGDSDSHSLDVDYVPTLEVTKTGPAGAAVGDTVTYDFTVAHAATSDGSPLDTVTVVDDIAGAAAYVSGDDGDDVLEAGETWLFEVTYTIQPTDPDSLVNTVTASALDGDGTTIDDQAGHTLDVAFAPDLQVAKSGPATAAVGDTVTYTYAVSHTAGSDGTPVGSVTLADDVTAAPVLVSGDDGDGLLEAGETWTYEITHTVTADAADPLVNTATVTGTDPDGDTVTATDDHTTDVAFAPLLDVVKSGPASAAVGDDVTYSFAVSHAPGSDGSPVTTIVVDDDVAGAAAYVSGDDGDGELEAGETWLFEATRTITSGDADPLLNTVTVTGEDRDGDAVPSATDSHATDVVFAPVLVVTKTGPATAAVGDTVTYDYEITHDPASDGSPVGGVTLTDDVTGNPTYVSGDDGDGVLEAGETWVYTDDLPISGLTADPTVNTATAAGTDRDGEPLTATDTHSLDVDFAPALAVTKTGPAGAAVGDTVTYTYTVAHAGSSDGSPVSGVTLGDDVTGTPTLDSGDDGDGLLEAGETWVYTDTHVVGPAEADPLTNTATVSGTDRDGDPVTDSDTHDLPITHAPVLTLTKTGPANATVGDTVTYTFAVAHDAASDGSPVGSVTVGDDIAGPAAYDSGDTDGDGVLDAGETWLFTVDRTILAADPTLLTNTGTASGLDRDGDPVGPVTDTHDLVVVHAPVLAIAKEGLAVAAVGQTVTYTFRVTHDAASDGSPISNVAVLDDVAGAATYVSGDDGDGELELGEEFVFTATHTVGALDPSPLTNTATASGLDPAGDPVVPAVDSHDTTVDYDPVLQVAKSGPATASVGDTVTYTFIVDHAASSDGSPVDTITVVDDIAGAATYVSGDDGDSILQDGEQWIYEATYTRATHRPGGAHQHRDRVGHRRQR